MGQFSGDSVGADADLKEVEAVTDAKTSARMARVRSRDTGVELALRRELHRRGHRYFIQRRLLGDRRTVDIVFPRSRTAVFVDGCFWHLCPIHSRPSRTNSEWWAEKLARNVARDRRTDADLTERGWKVVRVWEHDSIEVAADIVKAVIAGGPDHGFHT